MLTTSSLVNDSSTYLECSTLHNVLNTSTPFFQLDVESQLGGASATWCWACTDHASFCSSKMHTRDQVGMDWGFIPAAARLGLSAVLPCYCNVYATIVEQGHQADLQMENEDTAFCSHESFTTWPMGLARECEYTWYILMSIANMLLGIMQKISTILDFSVFFFRRDAVILDICPNVLGFLVPQDSPQPWRHGHYLALKHSTNDDAKLSL